MSYLKLWFHIQVFQCAAFRKSQCLTLKVLKLRGICFLSVQGESVKVTIPGFVIIFLFLWFYFLFYVHWYFAWMYVCVMVSSGTGVPCSCELPSGFWELKLSPLEAQSQLSLLSSPGICSKFLVISQNISCSWAGRNFIGYGRHLVSWSPLLYRKCPGQAWCTLETATLIISI